jgi:hypothetical protein
MTQCVQQPERLSEKGYGVRRTGRGARYSKVSHLLWQGDV